MCDMAVWGSQAATLLWVWSILEQAVDMKPNLSKGKRSENTLNEVNHHNTTQTHEIFLIPVWQCPCRVRPLPRTAHGPQGDFQRAVMSSPLSQKLLVLPCTLSCFPSCQGICTTAFPNDTTWECAIFAHECVCRRVFISLICKCSATKAPKYKTCIFNYSQYIIKTFQIHDF